ncbi:MULTISPECIES: putative lipid II flippase FtsW [unclassified Arthrobacter]|uniref:putative lipid II flippase FtsW n=1 Tax=unclassified Arthrobacter TaxID=235627 RepID=UPI002103B83A|nr:MULTISPECIES: putative lipid II flippase FtsW [unclassified Arthrobacter]MCQ1946585.1 putative lipid II flippase FtsW [Arthrobacter sp. zg-Y1116]MCQ1987280.1 putative lipid II flippase FtsW [Arthrobacter sp. zg-Y844]MCQ1995943.1 putative lipid II flippase FtsW [Arthrobacter sp. zg-Y1171]UWX82978.1 putative lipid II flippase FtsW [Arthrobacter sp. zg-Y1171]
MVTTPTGSKRKPVLRRNPAATANTGTGAVTPKTAPGKPPAGKRGAADRPAKPASRVERFLVFLEGSGRSATGSSYYTILGATLALTAIGLMMVLSASSVESIAAAAGSDAGAATTFDLFLKQSMFAAAGVVAMLGLSRLGPPHYRFLSWFLYGIAVILLVLVLVIGKEVNGNKNWIEIGPITGQPSEAAKLAMAIWFAAVLSRKGRLINEWKHALIPVVPGGGILILLVMLGSDLGTVIVMGMIMVAALFFAGAPLRFLGVLAAGAAVGAVLMSLVSSNRSSRISAWLQLDCSTGLCDQANAGMYALASGGWLGVGIGQSRQKWNWIPEAHNDFIFAIIGEEFGLLGTLVVVSLFAVLAVATVRVTMRHTDPFIRIVCGAILVWIIGQASVNIAMVTGLLPVIGVPLPFISYGGSSLTFTLAAVGVLLSFARKIPESEPTAP